MSNKKRIQKRNASILKVNARRSMEMVKTKVFLLSLDLINFMINFKRSYLKKANYPRGDIMINASGPEVLNRTVSVQSKNVKLVLREVFEPKIQEIIEIVKQLK